MIHKYLFTLILFFGFVANAQISKQEVTLDISVFPQEKVDLSVNSSLLLAGELLQYKGFVLNASNKPSKLSKVVYVSLHNDEDSIIFSHKLRVEEGTANGDYFIPSTLKTGVYRLIGYTNFSRNNSELAYVQKDISVLNTFIKTETNSKSVDTVQFKSLDIDNSSISWEDNVENHQITTDKNKYGYRERVTLKIQNPQTYINGNFSLSIRKVNPIEIGDKLNANLENPTSEIFYIPELRGELISGVVLSKEGNKPLVNKIVSLTIPGKDYIFKLARTNENGRFFFSVNQGYDAEESIVQINGDEKDAANATLILDDKEFHLQKNTSSVLSLDSSLKDWLQERSVQLQIENAYFDAKKDSILTNSINPAFYDSLGTLFLLDDYTRFPSMRETFIEVVTLAAIRGSEGNSRFIVNNAYDPNRLAKFNDLPPLVLMDGMLIQNNNDVLNYNAREIRSIRVVPQPYRYGPKIYSGIIAIETKTGNFVPSLSKDYVEKIKLAPAVKKKQSYRPYYSEKSSLVRIPDYRVQLFWEPKIIFTNEDYTASFYTSDVSGVYEIVLEGFTENGVKQVSKQYFKVNKTD